VFTSSIVLHLGGGVRKPTYELILVRGISKTSEEAFKYLKMKANI